MAGLMDLRREIIAATPHIETASGAIATFNTDLIAPLKSLKVNFSPVQDLHGYDSPWPAGGGKNKLDADGLIKETNSIFVKNGTQYTFNHYGSGIANRSTSDASVSLLAGQTVTLSFDYSGTNTRDISVRFGVSGSYTDAKKIELNAGKATATITLTADATEMQLYFGSGSEGVGEYLTLSNIQLELGGAATAWTPYENICPIQGWTGCKLRHSNVNIAAVNEDTFLVLRGSGGSFNNDVIYSASGVSQVGILIPINQGITYKLGFTRKTGGTTYRRVYTYSDIPTTYQSSYVRELSTASMTSNVSWSMTFTAQENEKYVYIGMYKSSNAQAFSIGDIFLRSDDVSSYIQHKGRTVSISWQDSAGTVYSGYLQVNWDGSCDIVAMHTMQKPTAVNGISQNPIRGYINCGLALTKDGSTDVYCTMLPNKRIGIGTSDSFCFTQYGGAANYYNIRLDDSYDTKEKFAAWLDANKPEFLLKLVDPVIYHLPSISPIIQLLQQNNVWADIGNTELEYWKVG